MRKLFVIVAALALLGVAAPQAEEKTWKGTISDAMCAAKHSAEKHGGKGADHAACVKKCVERGGEFVFVTAEGVRQIANQSFADLKAHAGHEVVLTGEIQDDKIVVSKIEMPKKDK